MSECNAFSKLLLLSSRYFSKDGNELQFKRTVVKIVDIKLSVNNEKQC